MEFLPRVERLKEMEPRIFCEDKLNLRGIKISQEVTFFKSLEVGMGFEDWLLCCFEFLKAVYELKNAKFYSLACFSAH